VESQVKSFSTPASELEMKPRIAALIPMRHHSERVPGKNYRPFAGRPLYHHIIGSCEPTEHRRLNYRQDIVDISDG